MIDTLHGQIRASMRGKVADSFGRLDSERVQGILRRALLSEHLARYEEAVGWHEDARAAQRAGYALIRDGAEVQYQPDRHSADHWTRTWLRFYDDRLASYVYGTGEPPLSPRRPGHEGTRVGPTGVLESPEAREDYRAQEIYQSVCREAAAMVSRLTARATQEDRTVTVQQIEGGK
jgi:hypothetical protein